MGEIGRTAVFAGVGLAALAGVAGWLMTAAEDVEAARQTIAPETAKVSINPGQPVAAGFTRLRDIPVAGQQVTYGALMDAERQCMAALMGQEPPDGAWAIYERQRLFTAALRHGAEPPYAPDGTDRFGEIVAAMGYDPSAALQAGRIDLADVQFAEAYMAKYMHDPRSPLYQGLEAADAAALGAIGAAGRDGALDLARCLVSDVRTRYGVDLDPAGDLEKGA